jgi:hypothetical protein
MAMKQLIQSGAARIAAGIHSVGANFDFEVLSLPGGSVIAVLLWLYASAMATVKRAMPQSQAIEWANATSSTACKRSPSVTACVGCRCV